MIWGPLTLPDGASAFPTYHALGVQVLQLQLIWARTALTRPSEPTNPADPAYTWPPELEQAIQQAAQYHIALAVMVKGSPGWANGGQNETWAPNSPADYANFLQAASRRYPSVHYWMIWGEPNGGADFNPMPADFLHWMRLPDGQPPRMDYYGHNPYSARFPKAGEQPRPGYSHLVSYEEFLKKKKHKLEPGAERDIDDIATMHKELATIYKHRPGGAPKLWLSEFSISSEGPTRAFNFFVSDAEQAVWLTAAYKLVDSTSSVAGLGWYDLVDEPASVKGHLTEGLLTESGTHKPAFSAYAHAR